MASTLAAARSSAALAAALLLTGPIPVDRWRPILLGLFDEKLTTSDLAVDACFDSRTFDLEECEISFLIVFLVFRSFFDKTVLEGLLLSEEILFIMALTFLAAYSSAVFETSDVSERFDDKDFCLLSRNFCQVSDLEVDEADSIDLLPEKSGPLFLIASK